MLRACGLLQAGCCSGYRDYNHRELPFLRPRFEGNGFFIPSKIGYVADPVLSSGCRLRHGFAAPLGCISASSTIGNDYSEEPFWPNFTKDFVGALKSFFGFLVDQPRQLRYIEWPTFSSTFKTATLTLVLVALLIVALATVDSCLCYLLALFLRRKP